LQYDAWYMQCQIYIYYTYNETNNEKFIYVFIVKIFSNFGSRGKGKQ
jgi:hypothetical protein